MNTLLQSNRVKFIEKPWFTLFFCFVRLLKLKTETERNAVRFPEIFWQSIKSAVTPFCLDTKFFTAIKWRRTTITTIPTEKKRKDFEGFMRRVDEYFQSIVNLVLLKISPMRYISWRHPCQCIWLVCRRRHRCCCCRRCSVDFSSNNWMCAFEKCFAL